MSFHLSLYFAATLTVSPCLPSRPPREKVKDGNPAQSSEFAQFLSTLRTPKWYVTLGRLCVCIHLYRRYAGYPLRLSLSIINYSNHYIPTNLEPRLGLWWPKCLLFCCAASLARGFETSPMLPQSPVQHLGCYRHARPRLTYLPYLAFPLPAYLRYC